MDTILDITKVFLSSVCFCLLLTDVALEEKIHLFLFGNSIVFFGKMSPISAIMDAISL